jgi:hypothetical protein
VTLPVLITVLATVGGILVVGVGGGLIAPMRERWEQILRRAESEAPRAAAEARANAPRAEAELRAQADPRQGPDTLQSAPTDEMPPVDGQGSYAPRT